MRFISNTPKATLRAWSLRQLSEMRVSKDICFNISKQPSRRMLAMSTFLSNTLSRRTRSIFSPTKGLTYKGPLTLTLTFFRAKQDAFPTGNTLILRTSTCLPSSRKLINKTCR